MMVTDNYRDVAEQGQHGSVERSPVLLVAVILVAKEVISHDSKQEHKQEQQ